MSTSALADLRDIHPPPPPFPATVPVELWLAAAALLAIALAWAGWRLWRRRRLRAALRRLAGLAAAHRRDGDSGLLAGELSRLLRAYAVRRFPGLGAEGLAGEAWLEFLDAHGGGGEFAGGVGTALAWRPYSRGGEIDAAALIVLAGRWLRANPQ